MKDFLKPQFTIIMALTLGLAPFTPEPHIWANIKWIAGGAVDMPLISYLDTLLHGTPWILFIVSVILWIKAKIKKA